MNFYKRVNNTCNQMFKAKSGAHLMHAWKSSSHWCSSASCTMAAALLTSMADWWGGREASGGGWAEHKQGFAKLGFHQSR
jgi:hypothetical protein